MKSKAPALTWANLPPAVRRMMSAEDQAHAARMAAGLPSDPPPLLPSAGRENPDGWRARMARHGTKPPRGYREHDLQVELVQWAAAQAGTVRQARPLSMLFAVPNAGAGGSHGQAGKMKAEGAKSGVPDLLLPVPLAGFTGAALELKIWPNLPRPEQSAWLDSLEAYGWRCAVIHTFDAGKNFLSLFTGISLIDAPE